MIVRHEKLEIQFSCAHLSMYLMITANARAYTMDVKARAQPVRVGFLIPPGSSWGIQLCLPSLAACALSHQMT